MPRGPSSYYCAVGAGFVLRHALHNNVMNETTTKIFPYLERLLDGEEVEWKTLGEVCSILRGRRLTKKQLSDEGKYPVFHGGLEPIGYYHEANRKGDTTMVINVGASAGTIGYSQNDFWSSDGCFCISDTPLALSRFIFYVLQSKEFQIKGKVRIAGIPTLDSSILEQLSIPLPPLRVQARIVEILDKFTQLEAELEAELEARRKQYAYYRDQILNFLQYPPLNVNTEWRTLGEVCKIKNGKDYKHLSHGDIPVYGSGGIMKYVDEATYNQPSVLIPRKGSLNNLFYVDTPFWNVDTIYYTEINTNHILPKFLYYYLATRELEKMNLAGGVPSLTQTTLKTIPIPLPPLSEQRRIVDILDRFDTLTNSISEGLPKEIALRRKQYAYYRDALLSFPRPEVSA